MSLISWQRAPAEEDGRGEVHYLGPHRGHCHAGDGNIGFPSRQHADQPTPGSIVGDGPRETVLLRKLELCTA